MVLIHLSPLVFHGALFASGQGMAHTTEPSVLIVEDEVCIRDVLVELFNVGGTVVASAATLERAKSMLASRSFDLIITDIRLGGRRDGGLQVLAAAGVLSPQATVIALTAFPDDAIRQACLRLGATHFMEKPVPLECLADLASRAGVPTAMVAITREAKPRGY